MIRYKKLYFTHNRTKLFFVRFFALLLLSVTCLAAGCSRYNPKDNNAEGDRVGEDTASYGEEKLNVVTTLFPYYDFLRQIAGDRIELTMVVPAGMDSHSFEPTPADMITIQNADILVCNGGAMEQWLSRVLDSFSEDAAPGRIVTMMEYVETVEEEIVEGMEAEEHDHALDHRHGLDDDDHELEIEYDEHIWTSPVNAVKMTGILAGVLGEEDPAREADYRSGADAYISKLNALDLEIREVTGSGSRKLLVFGDKFPLRYFFDEYGLEYRAAFSGCSTDTEPSAKTIAYLIDRVRDEQIPAVYYLELSSHRVAEIIGEETGAVPLLFHSCHNVTRRQFDSGITYLELMEQNVENLRKGLE